MRFGFFTLLLMGQSAFAQSALDAAKPDVLVQRASESTSMMPMIQMLITAVVLFGLFKWLAPKIRNWVGTRMDKPLESDLKIEESATLAQGALYVVSLRGKSILIGATPQSISLLTELTPNTVATEEPVFFEMLDKAAVEMEQEPSTTTDSRARLDQLIGRLQK